MIDSIIVMNNLLGQDVTRVHEARQGLSVPDRARIAMAAGLAAVRRGFDRLGAPRRRQQIELQAQAEREGPDSSAAAVLALQRQVELGRRGK
jgi:hypothetical protein